MIERVLAGIGLVVVMCWIAVFFGFLLAYAATPPESKHREPYQPEHDRPQQNHESNRARMRVVRDDGQEKRRHWF